MNTQPDNIRSRKTNWDLLLGFVFLLLGITTLSGPIFFNTRTDDMLPWIFIVLGVFRFIYGVVTYRTSDITINVLLTLINVTIGIQLLQSNNEKLFTFALIIGIFLLVEGLSKVLMAFEIQSPWSGSVLLFSSIVGLFLGSTVWAGILVDVPWLLSAVVGIRIIYMGLSNLMIVVNNFK